MDDFYSGRKILITGGLGFIGSNLAISLVERGAKVLLVDSMLPAYGGNLHNIAPVRDRVSVNFSDIRDPFSLGYLIGDQDVIFNLAGQVAHLDSMRDPLTDLEINCRSQLSLLECCRQQNCEVKIVSASTRQVYGRPQYLPVDEKHPLVPVDVNGVNKLAADMYFHIYHNVYKMRTCSLRMTNTYGPRMDLKNLQKGFVGVFIRKALLGEAIQVFGDGRQRRDFNYVDDVVEALLLAGADDRVIGKVFNLGNPSHHSLLEFVEVLKSVTDVDYSCVPFPTERAAIDIGDYYGDCEQFRTLTGWVPKVDLGMGLERTLEFFRENWSAYLGDSRRSDGPSIR